MAPRSDLYDNSGGKKCFWVCPKNKTHRKIFFLLFFFWQWTWTSTLANVLLLTPSIAAFTFVKKGLLLKALAGFTPGVFQRRDLTVRLLMDSHFASNKDYIWSQTELQVTRAWIKTPRLHLPISTVSVETLETSRWKECWREESDLTIWLILLFKDYGGTLRSATGLFESCIII